MKSLFKKVRACRSAAWPPGWHGRRLRDLLEVLVLDILALDILVWCCHCLLICLVLVIFESWQIFQLLAVCLGIFLSLTFLSPYILAWWWHFLLTRFALVISESWQPLSCWQLRGLGPGTLCSPDKFLSQLLFTAVFLLFPTIFRSLLSSLPDFLQLSTAHQMWRMQRWLGSSDVKNVEMLESRCEEGRVVKTVERWRQ